MEITVHALGFALTSAIREHAESRLRGGLRHFAETVQQVTARLDDVNGDHGGEDKRCVIVAALRRRRQLVVEATHVSLYCAIDLAADKIRSAVRRALTRHISRERKGPQRPGALWQERGWCNVRTQIRADAPRV